MLDLAAASFAVFQWVGAVHFLLTGVLAGNVYEAWQRRRPLTLRHLALVGTAKTSRA